MNIRKINLKVVTSIGIASLLVSGFPALAQAETIPELSISKNNAKSEFMGKNVSDGLLITSKYPVNTTKNYRISVFDKMTDRFISSCEQNDVQENCNLEFRNTVPISEFDAGIHDFQVFLEESNEPFSADPASIGNLKNIISQSPVLSWERKPLTISLSTSTPIVDWWTINGTGDQGAPTLDLYASEPTSFDKYGYYMINVTENKIVDYSHSSHYELEVLSNWAVPYEEGVKSNAYKVVLAHGGRNASNGVKTIDEITDVLAESNIVYQHPRTWKATHECFFIEKACTSEDTNVISASITNGSTPYKTLYIVSDSSGAIIANSQTDVNTWSGEGSDPFSPTVSSPYIADEFDGAKPTHVSQLKNIVFPHPGATNGSVNPGIQDDIELAGGSNPSIECTAGCYGDPVNAYTGEFFETQTDISVPTVGLPLKSSRTFSTQRKDIKGIMGYGWRNSYEMGTSSDTNANGAKILNINDPEIIFEQENGSLVTFTKMPNGSFRAPNNVKLTFSHDAAANKILITRDKRDTFTFDMSGKVTKIQDMHNNTLNINYVSNKISTVSDTRGNVLTFTYASNLLAKVETNQGRKAQFTYSSSRLTKVVNELGIETGYTYDGQRRVKTLTDPLGGVTENFYNSYHQVTRQEDPQDNKLLFSYNLNDNNNVTKITNPDLSTTHDYYYSGMLTKRVENQGKPSAKVWQYSYDGYGNIASEIAPDKTHTSSKYDDNGYLKEFTNALGGVSKFVHDENGNLLEATNVDGKKVTNTYNAQGALLTTTNALNQVIKFFWNADGTLSKTVDQKGNIANANPDDYTTTFAYTAKGQIASTTDSLGNVSKNSYDAVGRLTGTTSPLGSVAGNALSDYAMTTEYDNRDLPVKVTDELNHSTFATYDNAGNLLTTKDAKGNVISTTYNVLGLPVNMTNADGVTTVTYDNMHRNLTSTSPMGKVVTNTYDISGNLVKVTDPKGNFVSYKYDVMNRVVSSTDQKGIVSKTFYDAMGNVIRSVDGKGQVSYSYYDKSGKLTGSLDKENNKTSYVYDDLGRLIETILPTGKKETSAYDANGNIETRTNPMGDIETWGYDSLNRVISYTDQENRTVQYEYDANGNQIQQTRVDNSVVNYEYKRNGLLFKIDYPGTDKDTSYTYDELDNAVEEKSGTSPSVLTSYDSSGRIVSRGELGTQVAYEYNADSQQSKITYPSGRKTLYSYDLNGNLLTADIDGVGSVDYAYDERNTQTSATLPNGITELFTNDELGRTTSIDISNATESLHKVTRDYTANSNVKSSSIGSTNPITETYSHDSLNRTTGTSSAIAGADGLNEYNDANHIIKMMGESVVSDKTGKPSSVGTKSLSYDALGNRTQEVNSVTPETSNLNWTVDGSLSSYENLSQAKDIDYEYGSNGLLSQRESTVADVVTTQNIEWNENTSNALMISDGEFEYMYGANRVPIVQINLETSEIQYLHSDFTGSVIAVTDDNSNLEEKLSYGAYGKRIGANITRFGFAGEWVDTDTGYSYNRARWYDSSTAHFLSQDPLVQSTQEAYGYAGGNPLTRVDPSGAAFCWEDAHSFMASDCLSFMDTQAAENVTNFSAGFGDNASLGATNSIRDAMGTNNVINSCSKSYAAGDITAEVVTSIDPKKQVAKASMKQIAAPKVMKAIEAPKASSNAGKQFDGQTHPLLNGLPDRRDNTKEGYVYFRFDLNGRIEPYVGQAKNAKRYEERKNEHKANHPGSKFDWQVLGNANLDSDRSLRMMEEDYMRMIGRDKLSNKMNAMDPQKYKNRKGKY